MTASPVPSLLPAGVKSVGGYAPSRIVTNDDISKLVDTTDEWIRTRSGIVTRHVTDEHEALTDLLYPAAVQALERAQLAPEELDMIIIATVTGDYPLPSTACLMQSRLKATRAMACDIAAACTGPIYAMTLAGAMISSGQCRNALVLGGEVLSKVLDYTDRTTCPLLGDAAGAMVMTSAKPGYGLLASYLRSDGDGAMLVSIPAGGSRTPTTAETVANGDHYFKMAGREVFKFAVHAMEDAVKETLHKAGLTPDDVSLVIPHQANLRIINAAVERSGIPADRWVVNLQEYGNTGAGSVPLALNEAFEQGRLHDDDIILLLGFGGGLTWGGAVLRWGGW